MVVAQGGYIVVAQRGEHGCSAWFWHKGGGGGGHGCCARGKHGCGLRGNVVVAQWETWVWHKGDRGCGTNGGTWLWCMVVAQGGEHGCSAKGNHGCGTTWLLWRKGEHKWGNMVVMYMYGRNRVVVQGRGNMVVVRCGASGEHDCSARGEHCCGA